MYSKICLYFVFNKCRVYGHFIECVLWCNYTFFYWNVSRNLWKCLKEDLLRQLLRCYQDPKLQNLPNFQWRPSPLSHFWPIALLYDTLKHEMSQSMWGVTLWCLTSLLVKYCNGSFIFKISLALFYDSIILNNEATILLKGTLGNVFGLIYQHCSHFND